MKVVLQRVTQASVTVDNQTVATIGPGLLLLVGIAHTDTPETLQWMADKIANLRIFEDDQGRMNHSILKTRGQVLAVSQFTLFGDCRKGRRPSFTNAAPADTARHLFAQFIQTLQHQNLQVQTGIFQATMQINLTNQGPVTLIIESPTANSQLQPLKTPIY